MILHDDHDKKEEIVPYMMPGRYLFSLDNSEGERIDDVVREINARDLIELNSGKPLKEVLKDGAASIINFSPSYACQPMVAVRAVHLDVKSFIVINSSGGRRVTPINLPSTGK